MGKASRKKEQGQKQIASPPLAPSSHYSFLTHPLAALLPVLLLAFLVNFNVLANGFGWDDEDIIQRFRLPDHWWNLFLPNLPTDQTLKELSPYYRPLVSFSYLLDLMIWGYNPLGFHLSVLLVHLLNTALVFFLSHALVRDKAYPDAFLPLFSASLFAVHPVHAEAVAWIAGRNDIFCTTFILSSVLLYIRFRRSGKDWLFGLSILFFFFALLTKETAAGLVLLYPLYDYLYELPRPSSLRRLIGIRSLIPISVLGLYFFLRALHITYPFGLLSSEDAPSPFFLVIGAASVYLKLMFFPYPHNPFMAALPNAPAVLILAGLGLILFISGMIWAVVCRHRLVGWSMAWTLALLIPAIPLSFLNVAATPIAERYVYAPSIGFLIAIGRILLQCINRLLVRTGWNARNVWVSASLLWAVLVMVFGWESWSRNAVWRSPLTFWETAMAASLGNEPREALIHYNLGNTYRGLDRSKEAVKEYQTALKLKPDYAEAYNNLGIAYKDLGRLEDAIKEYQTALQLKPDYAFAHYNLGNAYATMGRFGEAIKAYAAALKLQPESALTHYNLATAYEDQGRLSEAIEEYQAALRLKPDFPSIYYTLGNAYNAQGRSEEAIQAYQTALKFQPDLPEAYYNLGNIYASQGRTDEAIQIYSVALKIRPEYARARYNLGNIYTAQGRIEKAIEEYKTAIQIQPDFAEAHNNLGNAFLTQKRPEEAIKEYRSAIELQPDYEDPYNNLGEVYRVRGQLQEAIDAYKTALRLNPANVMAHNNLGSAYAKLGRLEEARKQYQEALQLKPDFLPARKALESLTE